MKYLQILFCSFLIWSTTPLSAQDALIIREVPIALKESSGLVVLPDGRIITHNDSGNPAELFLFSSVGELLSKIQLPFEQVDFESITLDDKNNYLYIADIGNNKNNRTDLKIYRYFLSDLFNGAVGNYSEIHFTYPEQTAFPPAPSAQYFDAEALFYHENQLYIITKNRTEPFDGHALVYKLPAKPGHHRATLVDTLTFTPGMIPFHWVTGADKHQKKSELAVLLGNSIYLVMDFRTDAYRDGALIEVPLPISRQFEGIAWVNDSTLLLSCEKSQLGDAAFFWVSVADFLNDYKHQRRYELQVLEKQFEDTLWVELDALVKERLYYEFYSASGDRTAFGVLGPFEKGKHRVPIVPNPEVMRNGNYLLNLQFGTLPHGYFVYRFDPDDARKGLEELKEEMKSK
ncbi:MAG: hypothetical protein LAT76_04470 [Schleiferiaceae bacterium]|nr:hypothetical protein [Schleiferiaceae bacterium]